MNEILKNLSDIIEMAGGNKYDFYKQIEWSIKNKDHPLVKKLCESIDTTEGDIKNGIQLALGIVVEYLSKQEANN